MKICKCCRQPIKLDSKNLYIFDNGHGGIIDGVYQTPEKRSPIWSDGTQLFEGEFNRSIVDRLMKLCEDAKIDCINLVDTNIDTSLSIRTSQANEIYRNTDKPCIYISIHANGFSDEAAHGCDHQDVLHVPEPPRSRVCDFSQDHVGRPHLQRVQEAEHQAADQRHLRPFVLHRRGRGHVQQPVHRRRGHQGLPATPSACSSGHGVDREL